MIALVAVRIAALRAVVARERDHARVGEARLEVEDVAHGGRPEAVDRLRVVADTRHAAAVGAQERDDLGLQRVGVLELVDEHVVEALAHAGTGLRVCEHAVPEQQQVVVVQYLLRLLLVGVEREEGLEVVSRRPCTTGNAMPSTSASGSCALTQRE